MNNKAISIVSNKTGQAAEKRNIISNEKIRRSLKEKIISNETEQEAEKKILSLTRHNKKLRRKYHLL
jgi:hypothetical protein